MAAANGRLMLIKKNSVVVAGLLNTSVSFAGEAIDITDKDSNGKRTLLDSVGTESLDISGDGITKNTTLRALCLNSGGTLQSSDWSYEFANGDTLTGTFNITSYEESGAHNDAEKFTIALQSSGAWTYTAA
jgi:TP901-1 family phage major tail protein